jgi:hypothetical protein
MEAQAEIGFSVHGTSLPEYFLLEDILLGDSRVKASEFPLRVEHLLHRTEAGSSRSKAGELRRIRRRVQSHEYEKEACTL